MTAVLIIASIAIAFWSAPKGQDIKTIDQFPIQLEEDAKPTPTTKRPGDWLENSPLLSILIVLLGLVWMFNEFSKSNPILAISSLNTYNFIFLMLVLHCMVRLAISSMLSLKPCQRSQVF
jgi:short-chain fatty acids transporter